MRAFIKVLKSGLDHGILSPVLLGALVVPDACGAVEYPTYKNGKRYSAWFDKYVGDQGGEMFQLDGRLFWTIRNGMIHETSLDFSSFGFDRVVFTPPSSKFAIHMCVFWK